MGPEARVASFLRVASWIGGDRDGNPHVTAEVTEHAVERQAAVAFEHYLREVHALGAELSLSSRYTTASSDLTALAARSPDRGTSRNDEPYRRALVGIFARIVATARQLGVDPGAPGATAAPARPYAAPSRAGRGSGRHRDRADRRRRGAGRRRAPARPHARRRRVRLPSVPAGSAPAQRGARPRRRRAARARHRTPRLRDAGGARAAGAAAARARHAAAADVAARQLRRGDGAGAAHAGDRGARARPLRRARDPELRHLDDRRPQRRAGGGAAAQGGRAADPGRGARERGQHHPAVRDHRGSARARAR